MCVYIYIYIHMNIYVYTILLLLLLQIMIIRIMMMNIAIIITIMIMIIHGSLKASGKHVRFLQSCGKGGFSWRCAYPIIMLLPPTFPFLNRRGAELLTTSKPTRNMALPWTQTPKLRRQIIIASVDLDALIMSLLKQHGFWGVYWIWTPMFTQHFQHLINEIWPCCCLISPNAWSGHCLKRFGHIATVRPTH